MTLKYREAFHKALEGTRLDASVAVAEELLFCDIYPPDFYIDLAKRNLVKYMGARAAEKAVIVQERSRLIAAQVLRASLNVFTDDELDELLQATIDRARADSNWRRATRPLRKEPVTLPSGR